MRATRAPSARSIRRQAVRTRALKSLLFNALLVQDAERSADKAPAPVQGCGHRPGSSPAMDKLRNRKKSSSSRGTLPQC